MTKQGKGLLTICAFLIVYSFVSCFPPTLHSSEKHYEIHPEITLPESKTDVDRVIDAYERIIANYMKSTESNLAAIRIEMGTLTKKMDAMDKKISDLSTQVETIQKKLGIEPVEKPVQKPSNTEQKTTENMK